MKKQCMVTGMKLNPFQSLLFIFRLTKTVSIFFDYTASQTQYWQGRQQFAPVWAYF
jgi:hypothetical protein